MDAAPPGWSGEGVGGARKRWKLAKFSMAPIWRTLTVGVLDESALEGTHRFP
jgi:hypothetical protein